MLEKIKNWFKKLKHNWKDRQSKQEIYEFFRGMEREAKERWKNVKK